MLFSFDTVDYSGIVNDDPFSQAVQASLVTAKTKAASTDKNWENVIGSILKYGGQVVDILAKAGVVGNKNLSTITSGNYNQAQLQALMALNGGTLDKNPNELILPTGSRSSIDLSNPIVLIAIVAILFLLFTRK